MPLPAMNNLRHIERRWSVAKYVLRNVGLGGSSGRCDVPAACAPIPQKTDSLAAVARTEDVPVSSLYDSWIALDVSAVEL